MLISRTGAGIVAQDTQAISQKVHGVQKLYVQFIT